MNLEFDAHIFEDVPSVVYLSDGSSLTICGGTETTKGPHASGIYEIRNVINGKRYIGQSYDIYERWKHHLGRLRANQSDCTHLQNAWNKYGQYAFVFHVLELCNIDELNKKELYWIDMYDSIKDGYNVACGGNYPRDKETVKKNQNEKYLNRTQKDMSGRHTKVYRTSKPVICLNTGEFFECPTDVVRAYPTIDISNLCKSCKEKKLRCGKDENGNWLGWMYLDDYLKTSTQDIEKRIFAIRNASRSDLLCGVKKKVRCITTGEIFDSIEEAATKYSMSSSNISTCINGRTLHAGKHPDTGEKLRWERYLSKVG